MIRAPFRQLALAQRHTVANGRRAMTDSANQMRENLKKLQGSMPTPPAGGASALTSLLALGGVGYVLYSSIFTVDPGRRAIIWSMIGGLKDQVYGEGFHFRIPYIDRPIMFDVRTRPRKIESMTGSKDMQMVMVVVRVLHYPDPEELVTIARKLGSDYDERVLPSIVNEVTKSVVACYNASELLTKREAVSNEIRSRLIARAKEFNIVLEDVSITHLNFSPVYNAAVESKKVAEQEAERAKYIVDKALQEKRSIVVKAEGEARSAELIGSSIKENPGFLQLRRIDAAREISATISNSANKVYLTADSLLLNLSDKHDDGGALEAKKGGFFGGK